MELTKLVNSIRVIQLAGEVERKDIEAISYDSRTVKKNTLFVAITGFNTDGHKFILDAINKGATAVVLENDSLIPNDVFIHRNVTKILVKNSRAALAEISNAFFKEPTKKLQLIGITGTKGKTTTSFFLKNIFETAGHKTGLIGTIANYVADRRIYTKMTTPESSDLNQLFAEMAGEGCTHAVMEVSSHSLVLNRVKNLSFKGAVFTNITSDHLDFHNTFEEYLKAKKVLFDELTEDAFVVYNTDDPSSESIISETNAKAYSYGTKEGAAFQVKDVSYDLNGTSFKIRYNNKDFDIRTRLVGEFNAFNAAAAFAVSTLMGISTDISIKGIDTTPQVAGRFETVSYKDKKVIVDYSHTADSLEKALLAIHNITKGMVPVYTVFGCGGNRDRTKRPVMGRIASELSNMAIVTSDNPRHEDPMDIISEITKGIEKNNYKIIENREEAIKTAIKESEENAVILVAGKGHETYQEIKGVRSHFSDIEIAEKYLRNE
ncbi:MAG: UDP-N-acetylmuramoyl-L-alanyl-D-glutamate--2,6-diaminopimelate ligase [Bacteroidota bacterium]|jgi:UDP-N-acetylmuramoyl-L-alanyl-D-glutamate--2,6-diaminopimelate ligase|nr:UDP-N-acetylmuramoyl-L-alanyl-D-glutamate--2,6-diaminopimelate ligase [Ignavibacteria bacterium]MCU7498133.1 UDP-N-acetylmuramoyl-L-alanyl-D-glutamate--2,6-diaminopimelate ligase [Ignavibacteria bacterium]MCU7511363.1 UDP-N-acetylmuramoyl-L-alanyl-D-glutamate--2,6-diaminopimelate ligase [Ignavibacteria bacterium]MCU7519336.1 UDP-N-acetylmuramoyl-L-alanyl-D-glutamate--2,6-diaminopimelate ligase [Ignavibacteria bacterium]MCU7523422.1 UDP-N-acetylmuramoyl-L-alanyl-D-glutamate--2,6-diaminopimela